MIHPTTILATIAGVHPALLAVLIIAVVLLLLLIGDILNIAKYISGDKKDNEQDLKQDLKLVASNEDLIDTLDKRVG